MYTIECINNSYYCYCRIQDGIERWQSKTLEEAIDSMIKAAKAYNHAKITQDDIEIQVPKNNTRLPKEKLAVTLREEIIEDIKTTHDAVFHFSNKYEAHVAVALAAEELWQSPNKRKLDNHSWYIKSHRLAAAAIELCRILREE